MARNWTGAIVVSEDQKGESHEKEKGTGVIMEKLMKHAKFIAFVVGTFFAASITINSVLSLPARTEKLENNMYALERRVSVLEIKMDTILDLTQEIKSDVKYIIRK